MESTTMGCSANFGFLNWKHSLEFDGGRVLLHPEFEANQAVVLTWVNQDGFVYPPWSETVTATVDGTSEIQPQSGRPAGLFRIPPSHSVEIDSAATEEEVRGGTGAFVMHLLAYLFGIRLQFDKWRFDGRVPVKLHQTHHARPTSTAVVEHFVNSAVKTWGAWSDGDRLLFTNLLYMHSRAGSYQWDWEQFALEYTVFDSCLKLAMTKDGVVGDKHRADRKKALAHYGIKSKPVQGAQDPFDIIWETRNKLFHEALWGSESPSHARGMDGRYAQMNLRKINQRLIPAVLGYKNAYVTSSWNSLNSFQFDTASSSKVP